jgi:hypothetical protein
MAMPSDDIENLITTLGGLVDVLRDAKPEDRRTLYGRLGIRLNYHPGKREIRVEATLFPNQLASDHDLHDGRAESDEDGLGPISDGISVTADRPIRRKA